MCQVIGPGVWKIWPSMKELSWDGSASCNASDGELAAVGYSGSVQSFPVLLGVFYHQQWAGAEDGEGIRQVAVTGNE